MARGKTRKVVRKGRQIPYTPRCTSAEKDVRVAEVAEKILSGCKRTAILEYGKKKWGLGRASMDAYIMDARKVLQKQWMAKLDLSIEDHRNLVINAVVAHITGDSFGVEGHDPRVSLQAAAQLSKLLGLDAPTRTQVETTAKTAEEATADIISQVYNQEDDDD